MLALSFLLGPIFSAAVFSKDQILLAIYPGSEQIVSSEGILFKPDSNYVTGDSNVADYSPELRAKGSNLRYLTSKQMATYQRHSYSTMSYSLPVNANAATKVTLALRFVEMYFTEPGQRVFNVLLGEDILVEDLDIVASVGPMSLLQLFFQLEIAQGEVSIKGQIYKGAFKLGQLRLEFTRSKADNPIIFGIVLFKGGKQKYEKQYQGAVKNWTEKSDMKKAIEEDQQISELIKRQKVKQRVLIRNDLLSSVQEIPEINNFPAAAPSQAISVRSIIKTPLLSLLQLAAGVYIFIVFRPILLKFIESSSKTLQTEVVQHDSPTKQKKILKNNIKNQTEDSIGAADPDKKKKKKK